MNLDWADNEIDRTRAAKKFGLPEGRILIITLSRFVKSKRIEDIIRAYSMLDRGERERSSLIIAGDGPRKRHLERLARTLGLEQEVVFTGSVQYRDVPDIFRVCDIFVGTNQLSNMTMPPCEALLCGLPVVAYDVAGTGEVVRDGETGLLVEDGNVEELAGKIGTLINDRALREDISERATRFAKGYFMDWQERIQCEIETFDRIIGGNED
jgi:glycosyltransferase involved in cell wall biosynthesis